VLNHFHHQKHYSNTTFTKDFEIFLSGFQPDNNHSSSTIGNTKVPQYKKALFPALPRLFPVNPDNYYAFVKNENLHQ